VSSRWVERAVDSLFPVLFAGDVESWDVAGMVRKCVACGMAWIGPRTVL
jgi:hypothetical protein